MTTHCTFCFYDYVVKCDTTIKVNAGLTPITEYTWVITDKFNREYSGTVTTDAEGAFTIPIADLPDGLLTEFSGEFQLVVYIGTECTPTKMKLTQEYDCISFNVRAGTRAKNNLGCEI